MPSKTYALLRNRRRGTALAPFRVHVEGIVRQSWTKPRDAELVATGPPAHRNHGDNGRDGGWYLIGEAAKALDEREPCRPLSSSFAPSRPRRISTKRSGRPWLTISPYMPVAKLGPDIKAKIGQQLRVSSSSKHRGMVMPAAAVENPLGEDGVAAVLGSAVVKRHPICVKEGTGLSLRQRARTQFCANDASSILRGLTMSRALRRLLHWRLA
jgi:hypothetical protein